MNLLQHRFHSPRIDGPDPTQIQPSYWNDGHAFTGGAAGDVLTRDPTDAAYGAVWQTPEPYWVSFTQALPAVFSLPSGYMAYNVLIQNASPYVCAAIVPATGNFHRGARLRVHNIGGSIVTFQNFSTASTTGRFLNFSSGSLATKLAGVSGTSIGGVVEYVWDGATWLLVAHEQGGPIAITVAVGWLVPAATYARYYLKGRDCHVYVQLENCTVAGPVANITVEGFPFAYAGPDNLRVASFTSYDFRTPPNWGTLPTFWAPAASIYQVHYPPNWPNGAGGIYLTTDVTIPIL